ncbi:hypothetical protein [Caudoviricetes sp.]|nr:hypothetical protein [Caudoviricetes sp.]
MQTKRRWLVSCVVTAHRFNPLRQSEKVFLTFWLGIVAKPIS